MPINAQTLLEETKCYACYGMPIAQLIKAGLLNRILSGDSSGSGGSGAAVWGGITGTLANQTDLQAALDAKTDLYILTFYNSFISPADNTTYFLGQNGTGTVSPQTNYNNVRVVIPVAGTVIAVSINVSNEGTLGTAEAVTFSLNKNNGTLSALAPTLAFNTTGTSTLFSGLSFAVAQGDFLALQLDCPAFATNPTVVKLAANIVIRKT